MADQAKEVPEEVTRLREALAAFAAMDDDAACTAAVSEVLRQWPDLGSELRQLRELRVNALRNQHNKTWPEIAEIIGDVTPERAQQISKGLSGAQRKKNKRAAEEQPGN
ncbi:hypothetical protein [Streptomyces sp. OK228]|uniref:hypothetical protein n=1 Tax=Streptomyces sp. OK228 TaxID=1882786 RepID=UPI000BCF35B1|nr:hypothetical protein [Streptomyces sp. OK228]SOE31736.1 hypothetical protein SAMN05442782_8669 [Streptomyces sp. OK228]